MPSAVLVSWLAYNNDPFERDRRTGEYRPDTDGKLVPGPTLTLLFDEASPYKGHVSDVVLFGRLTATDTASKARIEATTAEIQERDPAISVHPRYWRGASPTDHKGLFEFLRERLPDIRRQHPNRELILNVSPGTPAMHAVWILVAETGLVEPPFQVVQTVEPRHRGAGGSAVIPVEIGIDTLYKTVRSSRPARPSDSGEPTFWDPARFQSDALKRVYDEALRYAPLDVPVLIIGERGTGKTTLASWIRAASPYRKPELDGSWPSVPCGQYAPETMRAELFGYTKGSFTGADRDHSGLLHRADGDTLFLDEIGDVSRELQRLLIRAIEDGSYTPLGSRDREASDFRLLTATNVPVTELYDRLDPDFLDRISPLQLRMPPLRELSADLDWIWEGVYAEAIQRSGAAGGSLPEATHSRIVTQLQGHPLSGNVRDLYRVAYRILAHTDGVPDRLAELINDALTASAPRVSTGGPANSPVASTLRACADGEALDSVYDVHGPIPAKETLTAVKAHIANGVRDLAKRRDLRINDVADVTDRTLLNWVSP